MNFKKLKFLKYYPWLFWKTLSWSNLVVSVFAVFGGLWGVIEMLSFFGQDPVSGFLRQIWWVFLILALLIVVYNNWPQIYFTKDIKNRDVDLSFKIGDILNTSGSKVIPINHKFDCDNNGIVASSNSILNLLIKELYDGNHSYLQTELSNKINDIPEWYDKFKENDLFKIGTVIPVFKKEEHHYFLSASKLNAQNRSKCTVDDFRGSLNELWEYLKLNGNKDKLIIPLIGTGRGRIDMKRIDVFKEIVLSFLTSLTEGTYLTELCIIIHPNDIKKYKMNITEMKDFIRLNCENTTYVNSFTQPKGKPVK